MTPTISVVITTYRRPQLAREAVGSVLDQRVPPHEIILVEDGSESGLRDWLESEHLDVRYVRHGTNRGLAAARNTGWRQAEGDWVAFLDDDDRWSPDKLSRQRTLIEEMDSGRLEETGVVYCGARVVDRHDDTVMVSEPINDGRLKQSIRETGMKTVPSSMVIQKTALEAVDGFDESLPSFVDHDVWMALAEADYHARLIDEPLVLVRDDSSFDRMTIDPSNRLNGMNQFLEKWASVLEQWMGQPKAEQFTRSYRIQVLRDLISDTSAAGNLLLAIRAFWGLLVQRPNPSLVLGLFVESVQRFVHDRVLNPLGLK